MIAETPNPNRRWFRFSLRGLFIVVAVLACWLAVEARWIRQRHLFLAEQAALMQEYDVSEKRFQADSVNMGTMYYDVPLPWHRAFVLWVFREPHQENVRIINYFFAADDAPDYLPAAEQLFPERTTIQWAHVAQKGLPEYSPNELLEVEP